MCNSFARTLTEIVLQCAMFELEKCFNHSYTIFRELYSNMVINNCAMDDGIVDMKGTEGIKQVADWKVHSDQYIHDFCLNCGGEGVRCLLRILVCARMPHN